MDNRPLKVFLCHAHADRDPVRGLYTRLTQDGVDAWLDKAKLLPGQDWELEIRKAVREADVVVVCLSKQFNQAGFRQKEVRLALDTAMEKPEGEIFIIPARLEECDALESLRKWHWVDLFEDDGYEMLVRALRARADKIGAVFQTKKSLRPKTVSNYQDIEKLVDSVRTSRRSTSSKSIVEKKAMQISPVTVGTIVIGMLVLAGVTSLFAKGSGFSLGFATSTSTPTFTLTATTTPTSTITPTATPLPTQIIDKFGVEMVLVPSGEFIMGSNKGESDEKPIHTIYLDEFYIDKYEVTNGMYRECVDVGICDLPQILSSNSRSHYYDNSKYDNYPVIYVDWYQADTYCEWRGAKLPTEAQWEKAARGTDDYAYPWGNVFEGAFANGCDINCEWSYAHKEYDDGYADTAPVGSYENGKSPYGLYDMAGNVWEWVYDSYSETYYKSSPSRNPTGPESGTYRVFRGGSFYLSLNQILTYSRRAWSPTNVNEGFGFRCASTP